MKDNHNRDGFQIKILADSKSDPADSDSNAIPTVTLKNNARSGILLDHKQQGKNPPKYIGYQSYCIMFKKYGTPERKYKPHISENCFGIIS